MKKLELKSSKENTTIYYRELSSFGEAIQLAEHGSSIVPPSERASRRSQDDNNDREKDWYQTTNFKEALHLVNNGWPKGLNTIYKLYKQYEKIFQDHFPQQDFSQEIVHDVSGEYVDIDKYLSGEPEHMVKWESGTKVTTGNKLQRIIIENSYHCGILPETVFMNGALIISLVGALESYGFRTEIIIRHTVGDVKRNNSKLVYNCFAKQFDESPDYDRLAFIFAHPSWLRRMMFSIKEQEEQKLLKLFGIYPNNGYGCPANYNDNLEINDLYFPKIEDNESLEKTVERFTMLIKKHFGEGLSLCE